MPFGSDPFRDEMKAGCIYITIGYWSPMPFGSDPFRDNSPTSEFARLLIQVTNAFRQ